MGAFHHHLGYVRYFTCVLVSLHYMTDYFKTGLSVHKYRLANNMGTAAATPGAPVMEEHKMEPMPIQQQWQQEPVPVQQQMPVQQQIYHHQQMA
jgi:hypothetical protein